MAAATGSPASRRLTKLTPLTTRPLATSRQGMIRLARPIASVGSGSVSLRAVARKLAWPGQWYPTAPLSLGCFQRRDEIERPFVKRAACDRAADAFAFVCGKRLDVRDAVD